MELQEQNTASGALARKSGAPLALAGGTLLYPLLLLAGFTHETAATLAITFMTAVLWVTEAVPVPAASLLPIVLLPMAGVLTHREAAASMGNHLILLFLGGMLLARGIESSGLHRRVAINLLNLVGNRSGRPLVFAFMVAAALLSMWISNTATALILMPIALAIVRQLKDESLAVPLILGTAFACSLGGMATLIGTPPNLVFAGIYEEVSGVEFGFNRWMSLALPVTLMGLPIAGLWLTRGLGGSQRISLPAPEPWTPAEKRVALIFCSAVFLWIFRSEPLGGWSAWLGMPKVGDSTVALTAALALFLIPNGEERGGRLLGWREASEVPWGILLLFAGGLTIASAFQVSGTAQLVGESLAFTAELPVWLLLFCLCLAMSFLTELTSNTASTTLLMPVMAATAMQTGLPIELMMIPVVLSASCAFMLPVATPPNTVAFSTGYVSVSRMMREGVILNLLMAIAIATWCSFALV